MEKTELQGCFQSKCDAVCAHTIKHGTLAEQWNTGRTIGIVPQNSRTGEHQLNNKTRNTKKYYQYR